MVISFTRDVQVTQSEVQPANKWPAFCPSPLGRSDRSLTTCLLAASDPTHAMEFSLGAYCVLSIYAHCLPESVGQPGRWTWLPPPFHRCGN